MTSPPKITPYWWMICNPFPPEPYGLWRSYIIAAGVTVMLFCAAAFGAYSVHGSWSKDLTISRVTERCVTQSDYWGSLLYQETKDKAAAIKRRDELRRIRSDANDKLFSQPWNWFESELSKLETIVKTKKYRIHSIAHGFLSEIALIAGFLLFYLLLSRLVTLHAKSTYGYARFSEMNQGSIQDWKTPQVLIGIILTVPVLFSELSTSYLAEEKTWFGYDSYCVTPVAFVVKCMAFVSFGFVASTPFTVLWCLSRRGYIPHPDISARDGKFGAERYVEFLQTWTLWLILAPSALGIFLFRYVVEMEEEFSPVRLSYGLGIGIIILLVIARLIVNAVILRFRCRAALTDQKLAEKDRAPVDPTISFIGSDWWKLPATISVSLATMWALLEFAGLSKIVISIVQHTR
jgi:hypothetical protein